jgi:hypothetical protein
MDVSNKTELDIAREKQRLRMRKYRQAKREALGLPPANNSHLVVEYGSRPKKGDPGWNEYNAERMRKSRELKRKREAADTLTEEASDKIPLQNIPILDDAAAI